MKGLLIILLAVALSTNLKAQQSPRDEYDVFAKFPQNQGDFSDYIAKLPKHSVVDKNEKGVIKITVLVDSLGKASVFKISAKISPSVDSAFVKAILTAPNWIPAQFRGHATSVYFTLAYDVDVNKDLGTVNVEKSEGEKIYNSVEVQPSFPGGELALNKFLIKTVRYPGEARIANAQGKAFVQFIVEIDGSLTDLKVLRDPGHGLGAEAMRVLKQSPKWIPGKQNGKTVRVQYTMPVNFSLAQ